MKITTSKQWALDHRDVIKGVLVAALSAVGTVIENIIAGGNFENIKLQPIAGAFFIGGFAYLIKNFCEPSKITVKADSPYELVKKEQNDETIEIKEGAKQ